MKSVRENFLSQAFVFGCTESGHLYHIWTIKYTTQQKRNNVSISYLSLY